MPTIMILIFFRVHTHANTGLLNHFNWDTVFQVFKFQALSILIIAQYGHRLLPPRSARRLSATTNVLV